METNPPVDYCFYCHKQLEYRWALLGEPDDPIQGYWEVMPCQTCMEIRRELASELEQMAKKGHLELDARDKQMIKETRD